jgi:CRISPR-associated protein Cmr6
MAHACACEHWLPAQQPERNAAWADICRIFGAADSPWLTKLAKRLDLQSPARQAAGTVIFHDAWPTIWPKLMLDLTNNHHTTYYGDGTPRGDVGPPNDAENPKPVNFLAINSGQEFSFALSPRRKDTPETDLKLAQQFLIGALAFMGAGAKTNAGYGYFHLFKTPDGPVQPNCPNLPPAAQLEATLKLITPAFLAGAAQQQQDCTLRGATLRGVLRWWWRTLHAAYLNSSDLHTLESAVWGDAKNGSPVALRLEPAETCQPELYDKQRIRPGHGLPRPQGEKTSQGLFYLSYGMDEGRGDQRRQRCFMAPGASWKLHVSVRDSRIRSNSATPAAGAANSPGHEVPASKAPDICAISAQDILDEVRAALWLLGQYGGVGSKSRKGFGSLLVTLDGAEGISLATIRAQAARLREKYDRNPPNGNELLTSGFTQDTPMCVDVEIQTPDVWRALDAAGYAYQAVAQSWKHNKKKAALGLPRKIHGPQRNPMQGQQNHQPPQRLADGATRYSSPIHISLASTTNGLRIRALVFPQKIYLSQKETSEFLQDFLEDFEREFGALAPGIAANPRLPVAGVARQQAAGGHAAPAKRPAGTSVRVKMIGPRGEGKRGYLVQETGRPEGKLGTLPEDKPPATIPDAGIEFEAFIQDDAKLPLYRWTAPRKSGQNRKTTPAQRRW